LNGLQTFLSKWGYIGITALCPHVPHFELNYVTGLTNNADSCKLA